MSVTTDGGSASAVDGGPSSPAVPDHSSPVGATAVLYTHAGSLRIITDLSGAPSVPATNLATRSVDAYSLSPDGARFAACADLGSGPQLIAGAVGAGVVLQSPGGTFCKGVATDGGEIAWIEYGAIEPHNQLRFFDFAGHPTAGDRVVGGKQLWSPKLGASGQTIIVSSLASDHGSLQIVDRTSPLGSPVPVPFRGEVDANFDLQRGGRWAVASTGYDVVVFDLENLTSTVAYSFPSEKPECDAQAPAAGSTCFFAPRFPKFDATGMRVAFAAGSRLSATPGRDIFVLDLRTKAVERLTNDQTSSAYPAFTADGNVIWNRGSECYLHEFGGVTRALFPCDGAPLTRWLGR